MFANLPKNLMPKFRQGSLLPLRVKEIVEDVLETPIKIPNYLGLDNPVVNQKNKFHHIIIRNILRYIKISDTLSLKRYFNNYQESKNYRQILHMLTSRSIFKCCKST